MTEWPDDEAEQRRAHALVGSLPLHRLRRFLSRWLADALEGSTLALSLLRSVPREELLAHPEFRHEAPGIASQSAAKDWRLARLMWMHRIGPIDEVKVTHVVENQPMDPLDAVEGPDALLTYAQKARGREASRAVGRLGTLRATDHLVRALEHKDSNPRTVAMRWLRKLLQRDAYMQLALRVLATERDSHLRRSLVRSIARKSFPAAFPKLVELVLDNDTRVAREALQAVHRLGDLLQPTIEHALAHERPDRARRLRELVL